jgi:D-xylose transport system ATP-binding protein
MDTSPGQAAAAGGRIIVEAHDIKKRFGNVWALRGASLSLREAAVTAVVGDNGAGKSTLIKIICGFQPPTSGRIILEGQDSGYLAVDGKRVSIGSAEEARKTGIETVYQDLALVDQLTVAQNLFLNRETVRSFGPLRLLDRRGMRLSAMQMLAELRIDVPSVTAKAKYLSGGQRQGVAISRAVHWGKRLVILDEPTAALGVKETAQAERMIARLPENGTAVLMISHSIDQVMRLASVVWVMRAGRVVGGLETASTTHEQIVSLITGAATNGVGSNGTGK